MGDQNKNNDYIADMNLKPLFEIQKKKGIKQISEESQKAFEKQKLKREKKDS